MDPLHLEMMARRAAIPHDVGVDAREIARRADEFEGLGWTTIALAQGTKVPALTGWKERLQEQKEMLRTGRYNIGLLLSGVVVIDKDGASRQAYDLIRRHGIKSPMEVETFKGIHVYMRLTDEVEEVRTRLKLLGLPLDAKMTGYIVAAGSWNEEKQFKYRLREGKRLVSPADLPPLPSSFSELLNQDRKPAPRPPPLELPDSAKLKGARAWIRRVNSVRGTGTGDRDCYRCAVKLASVCDSMEEVLRELMAWNAEGYAEPPWTEKELLHKAACAWKYMRGG